MQEQITAVQKLINTLIEFCVNYSFQVIGAILILILGSAIGKWVADFLFSFFHRKKLDVTLSRFLSNSVKLLIVGFAVLVALGKFGITIAPFIAALSAMAFGLTFAIQGPLANYGAGLTIILTRPFVVGNTITVTGTSGVVEEVKLACTILNNEDGVKITIPNKDIVGQILYNSGPNKIAVGVVGISYDSDADAAIRVVKETIGKVKDAAPVPVPQVGIKEFADSSINVEYRYWVPTAHYFQICYSVNLNILKALNDAGINIPFPQREVRVLSGGTL